VAAEAEPGAERQAHQPISGEVAEHGGTRVAGATQGAGGHGLDAVEKLEGGARGEEDDRVADDGGVVGVNAGDETREDEERDAHARHKGGAEKDGGVTGIARAQGIAAADGLTNADGGSGGDAERHHVGEGHGVQGDLVAGERNGSKARDERGDEGEDADLSGELQRGGQAEGNEAADALDIDLNGSFQKVGAVAMVIPEEIADENESKVGAGNGRGPAGAGDAEGGEAELAKDEDVVAEEVDEVGGDQGEGDGANYVHALEGAADGEVEQQREEADGEGAHVGEGKDRDLGVNAHAPEVEREVPDGDGEDGRERKAEVDAVDKGAMAVLAMAGAEGLGDEGIESDEKTFTEEGEDDEDAGADADGTNGLGAIGEAADHHGVHDDHAHPAEFGENEREGKAKRGREFAAEWGKREHR